MADPKDNPKEEELGKTPESEEDVSDDAKTSEDKTTEKGEEEDENVPFHEHPRWKEVYGEKKRLEKKVDSLKSKLENLTSREEEEAEKKGLEWFIKKKADSWDDVEEYLLDRVQEREQQQKREVIQRRKRIESQIKDEVDELRMEGLIKTDDEVEELLRFATENQISGHLRNAYKLQQQLKKAKKEGEKQGKQKVKRSKIQSSRKDGKRSKPPTDYEKDIKGRSLTSIVEAAKSKFE